MKDLTKKEFDLALVKKQLQQVKAKSPDRDNSKNSLLQ